MRVANLESFVDGLTKKISGAGGCDGGCEYDTGWDAAITEAIRLCNEYFKEYIDGTPESEWSGHVMTENEAKIFIQNAMEQSKKALAELLLATPKVFAVRKKSLGEYYSNLENCKKEIQACEVAVKALEEVQRWHTSIVNPKIKNVFANTSTQICQNCTHKDEYIEELEAEIIGYSETKGKRKGEKIGE